jgi:hypothetical protein
MFHRREDLEGEALNSLIGRGILRHEKSKLLWVINIERFRWWITSLRGTSSYGWLRRF